MAKSKRAASRSKTSRAKRPSAKAMSEEAMMAAWQRAMVPSEGHKRLEPIVGTWRATTRFRMAPEAPEQVSEGSSEHRWVLDGRYVEQVFKGTSMGMPFEGIGYTGYDNTQKKYAGTWMDSFGTGFMHSLGAGRASASRMAFHSEVAQPGGGKMRFECVLRIHDHDHHSYEIWTRSTKGKRFRMMRTDYTRS